MNTSNQLLAKHKNLTEGKVFVKKKLSGKDKKNLEKTARIAEIDATCEEYGIKNIKVNHKTLLVDVDGGVDLSEKLKGKSIVDSLGFSFGKVKGSFYCGNCDSLETLEGCPSYVGKEFYCPNCDSLKTLEGAPEYVGDDFACYNCYSLETLEGAPKTVEGIFSCSGCASLKTLEGASEKVGSNFSCKMCNSLKTLEGSPKKVGGGFDCNGCKSLESLKGVPDKISGNFSFANCKKINASLDLLKYFPKEIERALFAPKHFKDTDILTVKTLSKEKIRVYGDISFH